MNSEKRNKKASFLFRLIAFFIIAVLVATIFILTYRNNELKKERDELIAVRHDALMREEQLQQRFDAEVNDEYKEKVAREHGYSNQNEVIFFNDLPQS